MQPLTNNENNLNTLVPLLQNYLELSNRDRETTKEVISDLKATLKESRDCSVIMKLQLKEIETHFKDFSKSCIDRKIDCSAEFCKIEDQLRAIPSADYKMEKDKQFSELVKMVQTLEKTVGKMKLRIYTAIGVGYVVILAAQYVWKSTVG